MGRNRNVSERFSTPTTPNAPRETKTTFNRANHLRQGAAYVALSTCDCSPFVHLCFCSL
jgi:hypothetical protein